MKPTEEQIKEFWERWGFSVEQIGSAVTWYDPAGGIIFGYPPIDLRNLFRWAVPKFVNARSWNWSKRLGLVTGTLHGAIENNKDPVKALREVLK